MDSECCHQRKGRENRDVWLHYTHDTNVQGYIYKSNDTNTLLIPISPHQLKNDNRPLETRSD